MRKRSFKLWVCRPVRLSRLLAAWLSLWRQPPVLLATAAVMVPATGISLIAVVSLLAMPLMALLVGWGVFLALLAAARFGWLWSSRAMDRGSGRYECLTPLSSPRKALRGSDLDG